MPDFNQRAALATALQSESTGPGCHRKFYTNTATTIIMAPHATSSKPDTSSV